MASAMYCEIFLAVFIAVSPRRTGSDLKRSRRAAKSATLESGTQLRHRDGDGFDVE